MIGDLSSLAIGIILFAIMLGVGIVVLEKFGDGLADCAAGFTYNSSAAVRACQNDSNISQTASATGAGYADLNQMNVELGTTSGLGSWTPAIVALVVGLLFIGALYGKRKY